MACVGVLSLMRTLELEFLQPHPRPILKEMELISCNKMLGKVAQSLHKTLGFLMELFDENRMDGVEAIKALETKLKNVAFRIEDEIELQVVHLYGEEEEVKEFRTLDLYVEKPLPQRLRQILDPVTGKSHPCLKFRRILHRAKEDIDAIEEELVKVKMEYNHFIASQPRKTTLDELVKMDGSSKHASHSEDIMVGKNKEFQTIREKLVEHPSKQLEVVSIQGMGGIGKTTLARRVYEDLLIISHFDKRKWVVASQHHNMRQMLEVLLDLSGKEADILKDEELAERLYQSLKRQRYLVVVDDIWSTKAWNDVKSCFPNDRNGSRVLLTTRITEVANDTCSHCDFSHQMDFLDQRESWNLFYEKACKSHDVEFERIGRPVVEKCKGLPLTIIVVAGLFSKLNTLDEWTKAADALISSSSATALVDEECSRILSLSYNHLPHTLKACFLYLGVFPEDYEIQAYHLARLWFAEGLVKEFENESFDAVANRYVQELMDRNLIIISGLSSCGRKIKRFRMHDLLHAFCVREAQNENLLHIVMSENSSDFSRKGFRWVSIQSKDFEMSTILSRSRSCRSFFYFLWDESSFNFETFNLLRVCYITMAARLKNNVDNNVHLRLLWTLFSNNIELSRARNLQTLCCNSVSYRSDDGTNYREFPQLQYIRCFDYFVGNIPYFVREFFKLSADYCSKENIMNIPYIKKVSIGGTIRDCNDCIRNVAYLEQLEGLRIDGTPINDHFVLLKNLRKLTLWGPSFEGNGINVLSKLPRLEVLKLNSISFVGKELEIPEEVIFCKLIFLHISDSDLKHWKASSRSFPKLERLVLLGCHNLRKIPISFVDILTLESIKLWICLPSAVMSAKQIQEEQRDYGNENMIVIEEETLKIPELESSEHESDEHESD